MAKYKVIIRVDGNKDTGLGHIYRGIALAEMLIVNFKVEFLTSPDSIISPIAQEKFEYTLLPKLSLEDEPEWIKNNYSKNTIIVLDGYNFNEKYQSIIKHLGFKLVYIDDLAKGVQKADLVINHNPGSSIDEYRYENYTKFALGFEYALLRKVFLETAKLKNSYSTEQKSAFINFGGADFDDLTYKAAEFLCKIDSVKKINIVLGGAYKNDKIFDLSKTCEKEINIYRNIGQIKMIEVMKDSNFALAPSSTILFELLTVGIPVISGYFVDNQRQFYEFLKSNNYVIGVDNFYQISEDILKKAINRCNKLKKIKPIDGLQKQRIINLFKSL